MHLSGDDHGDAVMATTRQLMEESNRIGVQFLIADLGVALTFLDVAETTRSEEVRKRNRDNAHTAYDAVQRFLGRLSPSKEERTELDARLSTLRTRLRELGYVLDSAVG
jgi:hypothetical protein